LTRIEVPCPLCGSEDRDRLFVSRLYADEVPVVRCRSCGLLYQSPRPRDEDLAGMYDEKYYTGKDAKPGDYTYADERTEGEDARSRASLRMDRIESLARPGRIVDVGCSFGSLLLEARRRGWDPLGVDVSEYAVRHCREELKIPVHLGSIETAPLDPGSARVLHLSEVVEHLPRPREVLKRAAAALEPGGWIVVGTANAASVARVVRGPRWGYFMPGHVVYFSARLLRRLLEEVGFESFRLFRGDDRGRLFDGAVARLHATGVPGRILRAMPLPGGWSLGAGIVLYARKRAVEG
jgi:SAM-dependent methyltransferase